MQEEEKLAVTEASDTPDTLPEQTASVSEDPVASEPEQAAEAEAANEPADSLPTEPTDKISAIRANLLRIAQEEEEESVTLRVAYQIKQVKERKEHPEKFPPPAIQPSLAYANGAAAALPRQKRTFRQVLYDLFPHKGDSGGEVVRKSIFLLSAVVFLVCVVMIVMYFVDITRSKAIYEDIGSSYHARLPEKVEESKGTEEQPEEPTEKIYTLLPGAEELLAMNDEIVGWISIPDTKVDYPVLLHENDTPGEEYYLYRNVHKEDSKPGSIFMDYRCTFDKVGDDGTLAVPNSGNLVIYGHNMRDLSMFGTLKYYKTEEMYYSEHPIIELNSNYETYQYKIFGYFIADADDTTDTRFDYWNKLDFADEDEFYSYVNEVKRRTLRLTNVDVQYGDPLLTLSTCNNAFDTARLVIVARQVREGEDPYSGTGGSEPNPNIKWPSVYYAWNKNTYDPNAAFEPYGPPEDSGE